jgi:hypothetical protein
MTRRQRDRVLAKRHYHNSAQKAKRKAGEKEESRPHRRQPKKPR